MAKFKWSVNEDEGYFALGDPEPDDDLYIYNTTLISSEHFHLLGRFNDQESLRNTHWIIRYTAFDCEINSDPFQLSLERANHRTFIGDKATARVRANSWNFHQFLNQTSLEFLVLTQNGINGKPTLRGISFADLRELTKPDIKGLKASLDIIPQGDNNISMIEFGGRKPELRIVIELTVMPNFFSLAKSQERISKQLLTWKLADEDKEVDNIAAVPEEEEEKEVTEIPPHQGENIQSADGDKEVNNLSVVPEEEEEEEEEEKEVIEMPAHQEENIQSADGDKEMDSQIVDETFMSCRGPESEEEEKDVIEMSPHQGKNIQSADGDKEVDSQEEEEEKDVIEMSPPHQGRNIQSADGDKEVDSQEEDEEKDVIEMSPSPHQGKNIQSADDGDKEVDSPEEEEEKEVIEMSPRHQRENIQSGNYVVSIELEYVWIRSLKPLTNDLFLTFFYSPLGIFPQDPIKCKATRDPSVKVPNEIDSRCLLINDGSWNIVVQLTQLPDSLIHEPIVVEIQPYPVEEFAGILGTASIPFGNLFFAQEKDGIRSISDKVEILRNSRRLGNLHYSLKLEPKHQVKSTVCHTIPYNEDSVTDMGEGDSIDGAGMSRSGRVVDATPLHRNTNKIYTYKLNNELANKSVKDEEIKKFKLIEEVKKKGRGSLELEFITEQFRKREESHAKQLARIIEQYKVKEAYLDSRLKAVEEKELELLRREREMETMKKTDYSRLLKTVKKSSPYRSSGGDTSRGEFQSTSTTSIKYLLPTHVSEMTISEIDMEIARIVHERDRLLATGCYLRNDPAIREIDNTLTRLASDMMARTYVSPPSLSSTPRSCRY